ncbi:MAG: M48 family metalloprotease [Aquificaceae bacterium]|nr:M48 family metalloprotease [Aquificaceae bacterium]
MKSLVALLILITIPILSLSSDYRKRAHHVEAETYGREDVEAEVMFGRELAVKIVGTYPLLRDRELTMYVNKIGKYMALYSNRPEVEFRFGILNTDHVNAYSAPGGYIFITKGCLMLVKDESELAGILAHEIAHVSERHIVKELNIRGESVVGLGGLSALLSGPAGTVEKTLSVFLDQAYELLFSKGYKMQQEYDADRIATEMLYLAGYDPHALKRFLQRIGNSEYRDQMQKTHPGISDRVVALDKFLSTNNLREDDGKRFEKRFVRMVRFK